MNEYLKPVFEKILPALKYVGIKYWVYGGVAYASMVGRCYRSNPDVDLFVLNSDFENAEEILKNICQENTWKISKTFVKNRPKIEIYILKNNKKWIERLSVLPVYQKDNGVELKFIEGSKLYQRDILNQEERRLEGLTFFTISNEFLKKLFIEYLESKRNYPSKRVEDAGYILSEEEFKKYFPEQSYEKTKRKFIS